MRANCFTFSEKVTGNERKVTAAVIAGVLDVPIKYAGVPTFSYEAGGWSIDKNNNLKSPEFTIEEMQNIKSVFDALMAATSSAEGNLSIAVSSEGHTEGSYTNLINIIKSKESLIKRALGIESEIVVSKTQGEIIFDFYNATLNTEEIVAYITFSLKLSEQAKSLKRALAKEKTVENDKYAFRCFLLRLGFIGQYKLERKVLLSKLSGNSAFRGNNYKTQ